MSCGCAILKSDQLFKVKSNAVMSQSGHYVTLVCSIKCVSEITLNAHLQCESSIAQFPNCFSLCRTSFVAFFFYPMTEEGAGGSPFLNMLH